MIDRTNLFPFHHSYPWWQLEDVSSTSQGDDREEIYTRMYRVTCNQPFSHSLLVIVRFGKGSCHRPIVNPRTLSRVKFHPMQIFSLTRFPPLMKGPFSGLKKNIYIYMHTRVRPRRAKYNSSSARAVSKKEEKKTLTIKTTKFHRLCPFSRHRVPSFYCQLFLPSSRTHNFHWIIKPRRIKHYYITN